MGRLSRRRALRATLLLGCAVIELGCGDRPPPATARDADPVEHAREVKARHEAALLRIPGVVGVGVGVAADGSGIVIQVYVEERTGDLEARIPDHLEDVPVEIIETGRVTPR